MSDPLKVSSIGTQPVRLDGPYKVRGRAPYAYEHEVEDPLFLYPVQAEIARGKVVNLSTAAAEAAEGVVHVLTAQNAPALKDTEDGELDRKSVV